MDKSLSNARERLEKLTREQHARIIDMYFNQKIENMSTIAERVGYSRQRVQQIISRELEQRKKK